MVYCCEIRYFCSEHAVTVLFSLRVFSFSSQSSNFLLHNNFGLDSAKRLGGIRIEFDGVNLNHGRCQARMNVICYEC